MKLLLCGDFAPDSISIESVKAGTAIQPSLIERIKAADYSIVNLEAPVVDQTCKPIAKEGPHLSTTADAVAYLKSCGFNGVALANNHFRDYGAESVKLTIEAARHAQLDYVGGGNTAEEKQRALFVEQLDLAILNYCESEFSVTNSYGSNPLDTINLYKDIRDAKEKAKHVVVFVHGGSEGYNLPTPRMQRLYRYMIDLGAEAVVNSHQHCYSGYEKYGKGYIVYGLGNFFFNDETEQEGPWTEGYMAELTFTSEGISGLEIIPYIQCAHGGMTTRPISDGQSFRRIISQLNETIADGTKLNAEFDKWCKAQRKNYLSLFTPYSNRYLRYLCKRGLLPSFLPKKKLISLYDKIMCESHRDIILQELEKTVK